MLDVVTETMAESLFSTKKKEEETAGGSLEETARKSVPTFISRSLLWLLTLAAPPL